jgi:hypothetical protein
MNFQLPDFILGGLATKNSIPPLFWSILSQSDKTEFLRLRSIFRQNKESLSVLRRAITFSNELLVVLEFIERSSDNMETRAIVAGACFVGPLISVNTRQLKNFLGRCKSSINAILHELGYIGLRPRSKTRSCILAMMPSIARCPDLLRKWSVRHASKGAPFCFLSTFPARNLPVITKSDIDPEEDLEPFSPVPPQTPSLALPSSSIPLMFRVESLLSQPVMHKSRESMTTAVVTSLG